ncbi:NAD(P)/FAD-dependent oxidoreductase [Prosthecodimorpha staleyi]|uniref:FAD-dependent oxidoreductase n=1 Tax=Prosthecodimorpha staleyi TaxID=2840188 RepID=A0A947DC53_9HYPH|nr:FAD-dependent oxidoreductase [Prosthecodimorpha staleyi]MBT9293242.1 FAD-dependent oxidoreductase [Prosthecodimorpha staleyi]
MRDRIVIIGNGMAGLRLIEELEAIAPGRHELTVIGAEPVPAYNRVLLSSVLAGETTREEIALRPAAWYRERGCDLRLGDPAIAFDPAARTVTLASGTTVPYDRLVLATGSRPIRLPLAGADLPGVVTFRDFADLDAIEAAAASGEGAVVIGGGLLGIEAAVGLAGRGVPVTLVHLMDRLMERQLDARGAALLARALAARGIRLRLGAQSAAIEGESRVTGLRLADGEILPAGLLCMAVGIRPETGLAAAAGLAIGRGILVDDRMQTSVPGHFAIGECAEHRGTVYGLVEPAYAQARAAAAALAGRDLAYQGSVPATNLKVSGLPVFSAGDFLGAPGTEAIVFEDRPLGHYRKLVIRDGRLVGAVLVGDATDGLWYLDLIRDGRPISSIRRDMVFGRSFCEAA